MVVRLKHKPPRRTTRRRHGRGKLNLGIRWDQFKRGFKEGSAVGAAAGSVIPWANPIKTALTAGVARGLHRASNIEKYHPRTVADRNEAMRNLVDRRESKIGQPNEFRVGLLKKAGRAAAWVANKLWNDNPPKKKELGPTPINDFKAPLDRLAWEKYGIGRQRKHRRRTRSRKHKRARKM